MLDKILQAEFEYYREFKHKASKILCHPNVHDAMVHEAQEKLYLIQPRNIPNLEPERFCNMEVVQVDPSTHHKNYWEVVG